MRSIPAVPEREADASDHSSEENLARIAVHFSDWTRANDDLLLTIEGIPVYEGHCCRSQDSHGRIGSMACGAVAALYCCTVRGSIQSPLQKTVHRKARIRSGI